MIECIDHVSLIVCYFVATALSAGAIAGIVIGALLAVIFVVVIGIILICLLWSHKNKSKYVPRRVSLK